MSPPPYMRLYWGDYLRDTPHLTRSQHGAYLLLLGALWNSGGKLPADDATLARRALCTPSEWSAMKETILAFFQVRRGKLTHKRLAVELAKYETTIGKRKAAGKAGSEVTNGKRSRSGAANAEQMPTKPEPKPESSLEASSRASRTTRRERPEARADGASGLRVIEGGVSETEAWETALANARRDYDHFAQTDPDFASEIGEFIAVALERLGQAVEAA